MNMATAAPDPEPNGKTESRDSVLVEFNDTDSPWEPVSREEVEELLRRIPRPPAGGRPPADPGTPSGR